MAACIDNMTSSSDVRKEAQEKTPYIKNQKKNKRPHFFYVGMPFLTDATQFDI